MSTHNMQPGFRKLVRTIREESERKAVPAPCSAAPQREKREWWAVADDDVKQVIGYSCAPANPDMWWCPSAGFSLSERHHLFETEQEAIDKLIADLSRKIEVASDNIEALKLRRQNSVLNEPGSDNAGEKAP